MPGPSCVPPFAWPFNPAERHRPGATLLEIASVRIDGFAEVRMPGALFALLARRNPILEDARFVEPTTPLLRRAFR